MAKPFKLGQDVKEMVVVIEALHRVGSSAIGGIFGAPMPADPGKSCVNCQVPTPLVYFIPSVGKACERCVVESVLAALVQHIQVIAVGNSESNQADLPTEPHTPEREPSDISLVSEVAERIPFTPVMEEVEPPATAREIVVTDQTPSLSYRSMPPGTVIRHKNAAAAHKPITTSDNWEERTSLQSLGVTSTLKIGKRDAVVIDRPEVAPEDIPSDVQSEFEGYRGGRTRFATATDVYRYEQQYGDPEIISALQEIDDEELSAGEQALESARRRRGASESSQIHRKEGVATVRTRNPRATANTHDTERLFAPLKPIDSSHGLDLDDPTDD
jgi:hypothetical protein